MRAGEIHALLGENGAGKSTLVNVLSGGVTPDAGRVCVASADVRLSSPRDAAALGIGVVHQHDALVDAFSVAENLLLSEGGPIVRASGDGAAAMARARAATALELPPPDARVGGLGVGERQRVEIARALASGGRVLILDEATAVLTPAETDALLGELRSLADAGLAIVFITHRLPEVLSIADRVTVLRSGAVTYRGDREELAPERLARAMVGEAPAQLDVGPTSPGEVALELRGVAIDPGRGSAGLRGVDLAVRAGEVVAVAGVDGNGQGALAGVVAGDRAPDRGSLRIGGESPAAVHPAEMRRLGLAIVPGDRRTEGLAIELSVAENVSLSVARLGRRSFARLTPGDLAERARRPLERFGVRGDPTRPAGGLSGGNQQRIVLARELAEEPRALLLVNPTRGLDLRATAFVRREIVRLRDAGVAVLVISTDLDEVLEVADRVAVLVAGALTAWFERGARRSEVGRAMAGEEK